MIMPKAVFLRMSFKKNMSYTERSAEIERRLILSKIINVLRKPQNHRLGEVDIFVSENEFPILVGGGFSKLLDEIERNIIDSGYRIDIHRNREGLIFHINWTEDY